MQVPVHVHGLAVYSYSSIQTTPTDSRYGGYEYPDCWFALNRKLRGGAIVGHRAPLAERMRSIT